ncbi:ammonium transporter [Phormidium sp. CCY1219]|uniref:ammonium transporter n=1 Tax=Phormidium sp. CCY1219 TaxID=2886104 RepID=UPI002D1EEAEA|nr:ammonium transporter [Phormidium sp. CCY1219]MEB3831558.1 ammonium transporter [Phormidium sp. CCY1219]
MPRRFILPIALFLLTPIAIAIMQFRLPAQPLSAREWVSDSPAAVQAQSPGNLDWEKNPGRLSPREISSNEGRIFHHFPALDLSVPFDKDKTAPQSAITRNEERRFSEQTSTEIPTYETIDILWLLLCSGLVFIMQAGFMCLESGLTRSKNSINVAVKNFTDFGLSVALFWAFGFALMFGNSLGGWIGGSGFFLDGDVAPFQAAFFLFQAMFCGTATTIVSGAVAERMKFSAYLTVACLISGAIYPIFGHWAWNGAQTGMFVGWLGKMGFVDFAGSTVVHSIGGWVSLATLLIVGPRAGRFPKQGKPEKIHGSNLPISVLGALILWLGWFGFNGGSTLALNEQVAGIIVDTVLAGVAGMMSAMTLAWRARGIPDVDVLVNGSLAGLVAITASCHAVTGLSAVTIGAIGGAVALGVDAVLVRLKIDDAVGAIPVHLGGGIWGTLAVAWFGQSDLLNTGLTRLQQFGVQFLGTFACFVLAFGSSYLVLKVVNFYFPFRVSPADEHIGLNVSEHRAKTEILDLFRVMDFQAKTQDLSLRVPVEPFTEVGQIADRYNQVMDALEEEVTRNEAIVNTATDAIATFAQPTVEIITANPRASAIFGYPRQQLLYLPLYKLIDFGLDVSSSREEFLEKLALILSEIVAAGTPCELIGIRADGSRFPVEVSITEVQLREVTFYTGTFRDITHRKHAQQALQESEERFRRLSGATFEGILVHEDGKIIDANQAVARMLGYEISEIIGTNGLNFVVPEHRETVLKKIVYGDEMPYEVLGLRKDGSTLVVEIEAKILPYKGRELRVAAIRDVTARKEAEAARRDSEQRFRAVMEQAADAFIIHDVNGKIIDVNRAACDSLGYTRAELLQLSVRDIADEKVWQKMETEWQKMTPGVPIAIEGIHRRQDGTTFPVDTRVGLIEAGNRRLILALCRDITERKQAEIALQSEREKSEQLLLNILPEAIAEKLKQNHSTIADGFAEATVLFADIVGFTQLSSRISPTALVHLLNDIFSSFDRLAERHGLEKIKTIGDAYMVVGGLPIVRADHAEAIAQMALDMQQEIIAFSTKTREPFTIRIGIHSGPVVAGVIGLKKFIYDLWGDTVNVASRMESHGIPGAIQVTEVTYQLLQDKFLFEKRGTIHVKGKGDMTTYLLRGRISDCSPDVPKQ